MKRKVGVIVGRFQINKLTEGHKDLIKAVRDEVDLIAFAIGVAAFKYTKENPLSYSARSMMVASYMCRAFDGNANFTLFPQSDYESDHIWSSKLDEQLGVLFSGADEITLYCSRDGFKSHYHGKHPVVVIEAANPSISSTQLREEIRNFEHYNDEYNAGVIHGILNQWEYAIPCVDIAMIEFKQQKGRDGATHTPYIVLGRKPNHEHWQLPGGVVEPMDTSLELRAITELREETGLGSESKPVFIGSFNVKDWRVRGTSRGIITSLFVVEYTFGALVKNEEFPEVEWFRLDSLNETNVTPNHLPLIAAVREYISTKEKTNETKSADAN